jgi:16S rRNA (cytosine967-C5)-methyltransferase
LTPGARLAAAIGVLDAWAAGTPVEQALTNWGRGARYAGSGDRAAVRDIVFDVLRAKGSCAALGRGEDGRALVLGLLRLQGEDVDALFTGAGHAPAPLVAAEREAGAAPGPEADVPGWTLPLLAAVVGDDLPVLLEHFRHRAPLYLRVNARRAALDVVVKRLAAEGVEAVPDHRAPTALAVISGARRVKATAAFAEGLVEPQDLSVQRAVAAVDWPAGRILDYCAGGGGKALALADLTGARLFAHDAEPRRMADLPARAARAEVTIPLLETRALPAAAPFDAVLCDVPCSGSGTWRRDPEAKWRLTPDRLDGLVALQARILAEAARLVRPGGRLVYMTCSLFHPENAAQVAGFLAENPGWRCLAEGVDTPLTASEGFYHAVLAAP